MGIQDTDEFISDFSRFYILMLLYEGPRHGYNIMDAFKKRLGREISPSLVYPFLQRLEKMGLLRHDVRYVGDKEKKVYELTDEGTAFCRRLFKRFAMLTSTAIEPSLEVCAHCGCKVYQGGYSEEIDGVRTTFCCNYCANSYRQELREVHRSATPRGVEKEPMPR